MRDATLIITISSDQAKSGKTSLGFMLKEFLDTAGLRSTFESLFNQPVNIVDRSAARVALLERSPMVRIVEVDAPSKTQAALIQDREQTIKDLRELLEFRRAENVALKSALAARRTENP